MYFIYLYVVVVPLMVLSADQMSTVETADQKYNVINTFHLDNCTPDSIDEIVIPHLESLCLKSPLSTSLCLSP